jgi:sulfotransferase family protein
VKAFLTRTKIKSKRHEFHRISNKLRAAKGRAERIKQKKRKKTVQQQIFQLERELRAAEGELGTDALPDFVIIGEKKCGTTSLYHLLTQHPHVERAAAKELHFFNTHFDEGTSWYRRCFPPPRLKDGRTTITGEATPEYLSWPPAPRRMAKVIPQAQLIALLRNPVDRAYSDYQQVVKKGRETRTFKEAIGMEKARPAARGVAASKPKDRASLGGGGCSYLSRGIYLDHLLRWSKFFSDEQMLVLKSESFFERPADTLKLVLDFLELPEWEPPAFEIRNKGAYEQRVDPEIRQWLEEYFEPHNQRLYRYLGVDFGW